MQHSLGRRKVHTKFQSQNLKGGEGAEERHLKNVGVQKIHLVQIRSSWDPANTVMELLKRSEDLTGYVTVSL